MRLDGPLQNDDWESSAVFRSMRQEHRVTASRELRTTSERALGHLAVMRTKILDDAFVETTRIDSDTIPSRNNRRLAASRHVRENQNESSEGGFVWSR